MMGLLSSFKAMEVESMDANTVTYRTSWAFQIFGLLFILFGGAILLRLIYPNCSVASMMGVCILCLFMALIFILVGLAMVTFQKVVNINIEAKKIEITDSSILGYKKSCVHFSEISGLEISKDCETILGNPSELFVVRLYISKLDNQGIRRFSKVTKIFETDNEKEAREVAEHFTRYQNINIINSYVNRKRLTTVY